MTAFDSDVIALNPWHYWAMGEYSNTLTDRGGGALNATLNRGLALPVELDSRWARAVSPYTNLQGAVTDWSTGFPAALVNAPFGVMVWFNEIQTAQVSCFVVSTRATNDFGFSLLINNNVTIQWTVGDGAVKLVPDRNVASVGPLTDTWHMLFLNCSVNHSELYLDSHLVDSLVYVGTPRMEGPLNRWTIGNYKPSNANTGFNGNMARVAAFNGIVSTTNISALWNSGLTNSGGVTDIVNPSNLDLSEILQSVRKVF